MFGIGTPYEKSYNSPTESQQYCMKLCWRLHEEKNDVFTEEPIDGSTYNIIDMWSKTKRAVQSDSKYL